MESAGGRRNFFKAAAAADVVKLVLLPLMVQDWVVLVLTSSSCFCGCQRVVTRIMGDN